MLKRTDCLGVLTTEALHGLTAKARSLVRVLPKGDGKAFARESTVKSRAGDGQLGGRRLPVDSRI